MTSLKMDLSNTGLLMFFKPYQLNTLKALWTATKGLSSRDVWDAINREQSKASVINFLEDMTLEGLVDKHEITGKGGHRGIYKPAYSESETREYLKRIFKQRLDQL